jgi:hypothetical protein
MPPKPVDFDVGVETRSSRHRVQRRKSFRKVVTSDVIAKKIERVRRQRFKLRAEPGTVTIQVELSIFAVISHRIDQEQHSLLI